MFALVLVVALWFSLGLVRRLRCFVFVSLSVFGFDLCGCCVLFGLPYFCFVCCLRCCELTIILLVRVGLIVVLWLIDCELVTGFAVMVVAGCGLYCVCFDLVACDCDCVGFGLFC